MSREFYFEFRFVVWRVKLVVFRLYIVVNEEEGTGEGERKKEINQVNGGMSNKEIKRNKGVM